VRLYVEQGARTRDARDTQRERERGRERERRRRRRRRVMLRF